ncbi:MAG: hypothetical protein PHQ36_13725 [Anaerolineales bacterium]|nr:hypothetical protein [Anaerolineales bacterium]
MFGFLRQYILNRIEENGRSTGAPAVEFGGKKISVAGENLYAGEDWQQRLFGASAFYLSLPPNAYGVVIFPDGRSENMEGGLKTAPPGLYRVEFVDRHDRLVSTAPVSEMARDGEKLTLKVIVRYRIIEPIIALQIENPIETLVEHLQTDLAQYIRTHDHNDIADSPDLNGIGKILSFFSQRHYGRSPISQAIDLIGVELKEFMGDKDWVEMRRNDNIQRRQTEIERESLQRQKEIDQLKADAEKLRAEHKAKVDAIVAKAGAEKEELKSRILHESQIRDAQIESLRKKDQRQQEILIEMMKAFSQVNPAEMKSTIDRVIASREAQNRVIPSSFTAHTKEDEEFKNLTDTMLDLLK